MALPTTKTTPRKVLSDYTILVYGRPKAGKSHLCAQIPDTLFLSCEPGTNALSVFETRISSWPEFLEVCRSIEQEKHSFRTLVIDTIDAAYRYCIEYVCRQNNIKHESDLGYGKGYALVTNEFWRVISKLAALPPGLIFISHAEEKEIETRTGRITRVVPTLPERIRKQIIGMTDFVFLFDIEQDPEGKGVRRVIRTKPCAAIEAGDRTGRLPENIPMNWEALDAALREAIGVE